MINADVSSLCPIKIENPHSNLNKKRSMWRNNSYYKGIGVTWHRVVRNKATLNNIGTEKIKWPPSMARLNTAKGKAPTGR